MPNPQHARDLAEFLAPTLENARNVNAELGSPDSCLCHEKVIHSPEPAVDCAVHLELHEVLKKGLSLADGAGEQATGKLSDHLTELLEGDDHAVRVLWALLARCDDQMHADARQRPLVSSPR